MRLSVGDLVLTEDGYYGIVVGRRDVFLANGLPEVLDDSAWAKLRPLPINVCHVSGTANFGELLDGRITFSGRRSHAQKEVA